jgi:hypothetical protein
MTNMIQKLKVLALSVGSLAVLLFPALLFTAVVGAQENITGGLNCGADINLSAEECAPTDTSGKLNELIKTVINVISVIVGAIAVVMIIVGGFRYVTSGGKEDSVRGAKSTIMYALIGLVIVALAQIVVRFVLDKTSDATT